MVAKDSWVVDPDANKTPKIEDRIKESWITEFYSHAELAAFQSLAATFGGDPVPTAAFILNSWIGTQEGVHWLLHLGGVRPPRIGRAEEVFALCFVNVKTAIVKKSQVQNRFNAEVAVSATVKEELYRWGLVDLFKQQKKEEKRGGHDTD